MGGEGTFTGTTYQARVIAYAYAHLLAQAPLGWVDEADDVPSAVSGETKGPGDDAKIERALGGPSFEVQAKHKLSAGKELDEVVDALSHDATADALKVVLAIDRASTKALYTELGPDLRRLRSGRTDVLHDTAKAQLLRLNGDAVRLSRLHVVTVDVGSEHDADYKEAVRLIGSCLENPEQARAAWWILVADAAEVCGSQLRRTRRDLVERLRVLEVEVRPPAKDDRWHRQLDFTKQLLSTRHAQAVLASLAKLEQNIGSTPVEPFVRYRLDQQKAAAHLRLGQFVEALKWAERALDVDAKGIHALVFASTAALYLEDLSKAEQFADRALAAHPDDALAWGAKAKVAAAAERPLPTPPPSVEESSAYQIVLLEIADQQFDWDRTLEISRRRLEAGDRDPVVLVMRARALIATGEVLAPSEQKARAEEAVRLTTELIGLMDDPEHPLAQNGLTLRAGAYRMLGQQKASDEDLRSLQEVAPESAETVGPRAQMYLEAGDLDAALRTLHHPSVESEPFLLALRARVLADRKDEPGTRADIQRALDNIANAGRPDNVRLACAEAAVAIGDVDFADRLLAPISPDGDDAGRLNVVKGRIALRRGDFEAAEGLYREAQEGLPARSHEVMSELAVQVALAKRPADAVRLFKEIPGGRVAPGALQVFVRALVDTSELATAQKIIDDLAKQGQLEDWALGAATEIALRAENVDKAIEHLSAIVVKGAGGPGARAELARRLVEVGRVPDARPHIEAILGTTGLAPVHQMQAAQLLHSIGEQGRALPIAFAAFRRGYDDPRFHKAYVGMVLTTPGDPPAASEVADGTYVRMTRPDGTPIEYTIYSNQPIDPIRKEISVEEATKIGLMGKRVGEVLERPSGSRVPTEWTIVEILPAWLRAFHEAMLHFEERFPGEPFFVKGFAVGDGDSLKAFAPLIRSLEERKEQVEEVFRTHREQVFPLGFVVGSLGTSVEDVMGFMSARPKESSPVLVEWADAAGQEESRNAARMADELVVTRSALTAAGWVDLLGILAGSRYKLVAPKSLLDELDEDLKAADRAVSDGVTTLYSQGGGLALSEDGPSSAALVNRRNRLHAMSKWARENTTPLVRPLESIGTPGSREEHARDIVGRSSFDAVMLTKQRTSAALYADDLGLRRLLRAEGITRSVSTVSLVDALAEYGAIDQMRRNDLLLDLVDRHFAVVRASRELLELALANTATRGPAATREAFALLGNPMFPLAEAARIAAETIKASVTSAVQLHSCEGVVRLAMGGLMTRWAPKAAALALTHAARRELAFLPQHELTVMQTCAKILKGDVTVDGAGTGHFDV